MKILLFGSLADAAGREIEYDLPAAGCTVAELRSSVAAAFPQLAEALALPSTRACIDQDMVAESALVRPGQEVAFVPPLSGG